MFSERLLYCRHFYVLVWRIHSVWKKSMKDILELPIAAGKNQTLVFVHVQGPTLKTKKKDLSSRPPSLHT